MPVDVKDKLPLQGVLWKTGPHAPDTVRRRLATWSTLTKWRGLDGAFASPALKSAIRLAVRAAPRPKRRKSAKAVTGDVLSKLIGTCRTNSPRDIRDKAILTVAFASGGRRRSEVAGLHKEQLVMEALIPVEGSPPLPSLSIHLGRTNTRRRGQSGNRLSHRPACRCAERLARAYQDRMWQCVPGDRALGQCLQAFAGFEGHQRHCQAACRHGWSRSCGVFRASPALRLFDRSGQSRHSPIRQSLSHRQRDNAAVAIQPIASPAAETRNAISRERWFCACDVGLFDRL
jgi:hypothetical protein